VLDMDRKSLTDVFAAGSVAHILANDVVEHRYHWEAIKLLKNFHQMLMGGGFWKYAYRT
jgi:predicted SAM-dependent methyltransferase